MQVVDVADLRIPGIFLGDPGRVDEILVSGAERARMIARETLREARDLMGFLPVPGHHD